MNNIEKPPHGVKPERFWKEDRLKELDRAIRDRVGTTFEIPVEWIVERNRLLVEVKGMRWVNE